MAESRGLWGRERGAAGWRPDRVRAMAELDGIIYERRGSGSPLVLVHGIGSRWEVWEPVIDSLAAHHDVIAVDVPGFGLSARPESRIPAGIDSLCDLLQEFLAKLGVEERPHVVGNSMGGWIALELARRDAVASCVALSPGGFSTRADVGWIVPLIAIQRVAAALMRPFASRLFASAAGRRAGWRIVVAHPERMSPRDAVLGLRGMAEAPWFWRTLFALAISSFADGTAISAPTTIAWGDQDHLLPPRHAATALARIPTAAFRALPDCGHVPMYDNPELVTRVILETVAVGSGSGVAVAP